MTPENERLYLEGKYICVHCRKNNGYGCNQNKFVRTDCTRVNFGSESMCRCNHKGGFISK